MKPSQTTPIFIVILLCFAFAANSQNRLSSVKIFVQPSSAERLNVISLLQLDHFQEENGAIQAELTEEELLRLKKSNFKYQVVIEDVGENLQEVNRSYFEGRRNGTIGIDGKPTGTGAGNRVAFEQTGSLLDNVIFTPSAFQVHATFGGYYSFAQMEAAMDALVAAYPTIASKTSIGTSVEGRDIWVIKISDNVATDETGEPEVFFQGVQHAREAIGGSSMLFLMQYLCEAYATGDTRIINLVNNREIFIIPCMNPDGWEYNRSTNPNGGGSWRKNRKIIAVGPTQYGVDLNRNWNVDWANCSGAVGGTSCGSGTATSSNGTYWGTAPFSEPETQAVRDFIRSHHIVVANDQHSYGPYYSLPFGRPALHTGADSLMTVDQQWYTCIPALMGKYNGMRAGNSVQALGYEVAGGVKDWFFKGDIGTGVGSGLKTVIYGMTGEGGYRAASATFWPPAAQIVTLCKGMIYQDLQMIYSAGSYVDIQDVSDIALTSTTGTLDFRVKRIGLEDQPVTVSIVPLANISAGAPVVIGSLPNFYDTYSGSISYTLPASITNGQYLRFIWRVETGGQVYDDTITKFYNPTQLLYDNMEGASVATNWTVSAGWNYLADSGYAGSKALTESPNAAYPASATRTAQYTGTLNLTGATAAYITFWVKHRAENFHDKLQVQVSPDGVTWTALTGKTTVAEPGTLEGSTINGQPALTGIKDDWVKEAYNLSGFLGATNLRLRFVFTSDGASSFWAAQDAGFLIDELKVIKSMTTLVTLPVNFISFTAKLTPLNTVLLDWVAEVDSKHSHFIAEKSTDGQNYTAIGRVDNLPYSLVDPHPAIGINYYRIKQYDIDGQFAYSKVNTVYFNPARFSMIVYPNPASEDVTFRFTAERTEAINIQVSDLSGKIVYTRQVMAGGNNSQELKINVRGWPSQTYIVKAIRNDNTYLSVQKFIRQ